MKSLECRLILAEAAENETSQKDSTQESCLLGEGNPSRTVLRMSIRGRVGVSDSEGIPWQGMCVGGLLSGSGKVFLKSRRKHSQEKQPAIN